MRHKLRLLAFVLAPLAALLAGALPASAHPMGNFSINHYAALTVGPAAVRLLYIVDMAEIPTFQELGSLNATHGADLAPARLAAYLSSKVHALAAGLSLRLDGRPLRLSLRADDLIFPPGAGGLPTERLYLLLQAPLPRAGGTLAYGDANFPDRSGWKEVVASAAPGAAVSGASVPSASRSAGLTIYPSNATSSPPQDVAATLRVISVPGAARAFTGSSPATVIRQAEAPLRGPDGTWSTLAQRLVVKGPAAATWAQGRQDALTALIARRDLPPAALAFSLLIAFGLGALHAFSPGHGKTVVAAYIVGSRATAWHAALLGLTVTATHTVGVFALGAVTLWLSQYIVPDRLYPWLGALSGLGIVVIGLSLAAHRLAALRRPRAVHAYDHARIHDIAHAHLPDGRVVGLPPNRGRAHTDEHTHDEETHRALEIS